LWRVWCAAVCGRFQLRRYAFQGSGQQAAVLAVGLPLLLQLAL